MSRGAPWIGFNYIEGRKVERTREEWRAIMNKSHRRDRIGGDLILFDENGEMTHEIYDKD